MKFLVALLFRFRIFRVLFKQRAWDADFMGEYRVWYSDHSSDTPSRIPSLVASQSVPGAYSLREGEPPDRMDQALKALFGKRGELWIQTHTRNQLHMLLKPCEPPPPPPAPPAPPECTAGPPPAWIQDFVPHGPPPSPKPNNKKKAKKPKPNKRKKNAPRPR